MGGIESWAKAERWWIAFFRKALPRSHPERRDTIEANCRDRAAELDVYMDIARRHFDDPEYNRLIVEID